MVRCHVYQLCRDNVVGHRGGMLLLVTNGRLPRLGSTTCHFPAIAFDRHTARRSATCWPTVHPALYNALKHALIPFKLTHWVETLNFI